jgi:hypothetical protein
MAAKYFTYGCVSGHKHAGEIIISLLILSTKCGFCDL